jgi:hypothetical protein
VNSGRFRNDECVGFGLSPRDFLALGSMTNTFLSKVICRRYSEGESQTENNFVVVRLLLNVSVTQRNVRAPMK